MRVLTWGLLGLACLAQGPALAADLVIATAGGAYAKARRVATFDPFTAATGITVREDTYTGGLSKVRAMVDARNTTWDIFQVDTQSVVRGCDDGILVRIDWLRIADRDKLLPIARHDCAVGAVIGPTVLAHDADKLGPAPKTWADFWDVAKYPGKRALRRDAQTTMEAALIADGVPKTEVYKLLATEAGVVRAFRKLDQIRPHVLWWDQGAQPREWLASGQVSMTSAFGGRIASAIEEGKNFVIDWEGSFYDVSWWAMVAGSANTEAGYKFLDFASTAKMQAAFSQIWSSGPVNRDADALLGPERLKLLPTSTTLVQSIYIDDAFWSDHYDDLQRRFSTWLSKS